jgi:hypothetical protein
MKRGEQLIHTLFPLPTLQRSYVMKLERHYQNTSIIRKSKNSLLIPLILHTNFYFLFLFETCLLFGSLHLTSY